uniref:Vacuolar protein sorting-associated protein 9a-like n=1 Tax=Tetraselmis sp. GSL018 TaxID=582737 RepID=A0A061S7F7_9CHLO
MDDSFNSASPLTFTDFLEKMKDPKAADLVRAIKTFIASFKNAVSDADGYGQRVQEFLSASDESFRTHPLWAGSSAAELDAAGEGLEKYVMTKLYDRCFRASPEDREGDEILSLHLRALQFVKPEHLDIPDYFRNDAQWVLAQKELQKINSYKAPRDKLVCILNCCRVITNLLAAKGGAPAGADDFFPVLVYIVIRTNPPNLKSNLEYIRRFRAASRLVSEAEYFYTNMQSAAQFVELISPDRLSVDPDVFLAHMLEAGVPIERLQRDQSLPPLQGDGARLEGGGGQPEPAAAAPPPALVLRDDLPPLVARRSAAELEAEGAALLMEAERRGELRSAHRFLYAGFGDLSVADVEALLAAHKELVLRHEALSRAVDAQPLLEPSQLLRAQPPGSPAGLAAPPGRGATQGAVGGGTHARGADSPPSPGGAEPQPSAGPGNSGEREAEALPVAEGRPAGDGALKGNPPKAAVALHQPEATSDAPAALEVPGASVTSVTGPRIPEGRCQTAGSATALEGGSPEGVAASSDQGGEAAGRAEANLLLTEPQPPSSVPGSEEQVPSAVEAVSSLELSVEDASGGSAALTSALAPADPSPRSGAEAARGTEEEDGTAEREATPAVSEPPLQQADDLPAEPLVPVVRDATILSADVPGGKDEGEKIQTEALLLSPGSAAEEEGGPAEDPVSLSHENPLYDELATDRNAVEERDACDAGQEGGDPPAAPSADTPQQKGLEPAPEPGESRPELVSEPTIGDSPSGAVLDGSKDGAEDLFSSMTVVPQGSSGGSESQPSPAGSQGGAKGPVLSP